MTQPEPEHWPTERMILDGHAEYATPEDLEGLAEADLIKIAEICEVDSFAPEACVPCLAHTMIIDLRVAERERLETMNPPDSAASGEEEFTNYLDLRDDIDAEGNFIGEEPEGFIPVELKRRPPVEVLQWQVAMLAQTLEEIVDGPPIPPKDVNLPELALLVLAADKWVKTTEAQEIELSDQQQSMLDNTKSLVARLRP